MLDMLHLQLRRLVPSGGVAGSPVGQRFRRRAVENSMAYGWPWIRAVGGLVGWPQYQVGRTAGCTILASSSKATRVAAPKIKKSKPSLAGRKHSEVNGNLYKGGCIIKVKVSDEGELNSLMEDEKYWKLHEEEDGKH